MPSAAAAKPATQSKAADYRAKLDQLLGEHLILTAKVTGAALGGRQDQAAAYRELLDQNGNEIGAMVGSVYGADARGRFNQIWAARNGFVADYTAGLAGTDRARQDRAASDLAETFPAQLAALIAGPSGLAQATVTDLARTQDTATRQIIDDQSVHNWTAAYADIRRAYAQMQNLGDALGQAIVKNRSEKFPGDATTRAVGLRVSLDQMLLEHRYLASFATDAAIAGRTDEFAAAGRALNDNGADLGAAIGSLFGTDAQARFNAIWTAQIGMLVDYTAGLIANDKARQQRAIGELTTTFVQQFADLVSSLTALAQATAADLARTQVEGARSVADAQAAKDIRGAATRDRTAAQQTDAAGDALAGAIVKRLPGKFA